MGDFNYKEYLKNNPLLQEEVKEEKLITESQEEVQEYVETSGDPLGDDLKKLKAFVDKSGSKAKAAFKNFLDSIEVGSMQQAMASEELEVTEEETLNEGVFDKLKDKVLNVADKIKSKFSDSEVAKMKSIVKTALGKDQLEPSDITLDNLKKVINVMKGQLAEGQLEESLEDKLEDILGPILPVGGFPSIIGGLGSIALGNSPILLLGGIVAMIIGGLINKNSSYKNIDENEEITEKASSKMKVSELKAKIKEDIISLLQEAEEDVDVDVKDEVEADVDVDVKDKVDVDAEGDDIEIEKKAVKAKVEVGLSPEEEIVQDSLKAAMDAAESLGNDILVDQIGNTITYFTRKVVVGDRTD